MEEAPLKLVMGANEWWRHLPDCVKVALFEDYGDLNEHDGERGARTRCEGSKCLNHTVIPGSREGEESINISRNKPVHR